MAGRGGRERRDLGEIVRDLSPDVLCEIVVSAADRHDDVERHVWLAAAREEGDLTELRAEISWTADAAVPGLPGELGVGTRGAAGR